MGLREGIGRMISAALRPSRHSLRHDAIDDRMAETDREMDEIEMRLRRLEARATLRRRVADDRRPEP